jgi:hypothetical protein
MRRSHRSLLLSVLILVGGLVTPALGPSARVPVGLQSMPGQLTYFYAAHTDQPAPKVQAPAEFLRQRANGMRTQTATFTVNYTGFSAQAQTAFQFAVDIWASKITSSVPIVVNANWTSLGFGILGSAGPNNFYSNFSGAPMLNTWYPVAIANKLAGTDLDGSGTEEIDANFSSNFPDWYFGTDGNTPVSQYDFASVVLHELGHGLGFSGSMRVGSFCGVGQGCWGSTTSYPFIYDRFAVNGSGQSLIDTNLFANYSTTLAAQLTSDNVYFNGPNAVKANGNANVKLYAPGTFSSGSSYSHLDNVFNGTPNALMTFSISNGEVQHDPGPVMLCMFKDMGWTVTVSGSSVASLESAPGFVVFSPDNVRVMVTNTIYLPLIMNSFSTAPC